MFSLIMTIHILSISMALGGRILFMPMLKLRIREGMNERLDELRDSFVISRWSDYGLIVALLTGILLFFVNGVSMAQSHWAFKLKLITLLLVITDIGAFHVARIRVLNHYDTQMLPALKRLNSLAVILMSCMVFFATFS